MQCACIEYARNVCNLEGADSTEFEPESPHRIIYKLRDLIGVEPFWRGIRLYYQRYMNSVASTADFRRVMEEVSGQDLRWFFAQWLHRPFFQNGTTRTTFLQYSCAFQRIFIVYG